MALDPLPKKRHSTVFGGKSIQWLLAPCPESASILSWAGRLYIGFWPRAQKATAYCLWWEVYTFDFSPHCPKITQIALGWKFINWLLTPHPKKTRILPPVGSVRIAFLAITRKLQNTVFGGNCVTCILGPLPKKERILSWAGSVYSGF